MSFTGTRREDQSETSKDVFVFTRFSFRSMFETLCVVWNFHYMRVWLFEKLGCKKKLHCTSKAFKIVLTWLVYNFVYIKFVYVTFSLTSFWESTRTCSTRTCSNTRTHTVYYTCVYYARIVHARRYT